LGVVDLRELIITADHITMADIMVSPVVTVEEDDLLEDISEMFEKYHYRLFPVVDSHDLILGVVYHQDIMKNASIRLKK
jgi:Mg/Co/Ni transporter MgtE